MFVAESSLVLKKALEKYTDNMTYDINLPSTQLNHSFLLPDTLPTLKASYLLMHGLP